MIAGGSSSSEVQDSEQQHRDRLTEVEMLADGRVTQHRPRLPDVGLDDNGLPRLGEQRPPM